MNFILFFIVFLAEIATDLYVPSLPLLAEDFGTSNQIVQMSMSLHLIGFAIGQPVYGFLSDIYGRRGVVLWGFSLFVVSSFACGMSQSVNQLIFFRFLQGLGACVAPVIALAMLKDLYTDSSQNIKMVALLSLTMSLSPIIGPVLGSLIALISGWQGNFYLLFLGGVAVLPFLFFRLHDTRDVRHTGSFNWLELLRHSSFRKCVLINALLVSIVWLFITEAPFILIQNYGLSLMQYSLYQVVTVIGYMIGGGIANRLAGKLTPQKMISMGFAIISVGAISLLLLSFAGRVDPLLFVIFIAIFECGLGIARPAILNKIMDCFPQLKGTSAAVVGTSEMAISACVIFCSGLVNTGELHTLIWLMTGVIVCAIILYVSERCCCVARSQT